VTRDRLWTSALCLLLVGVQSVGLTRPFVRHHESVATEFSKHARNHLKFGLGTTFGLRLDVSGPDLAAYPEYRTFFYPDHPPLPALLLAGVFAVAGPGEVPFRLMLMGFSLAALLLFRAMARRLLPAPWDLAATAFFAFVPAFAFYSIVTCLQVTCLAGVLAALLSYLRWRDSGRRADYAGILGGIAFAGLCAWPGYYVALVVLAAHVRSGRPGGRAVAFLPVFNLLLFGAYCAWLWAADPAGLDPLRQLVSVALDRSTLRGPAPVAYALGEARELALMFTLPVLALAGLGVVQARGRTPSGDGRFIAATALLGLDEVVFARVASGHEYFSYPLAVFLALAAGAGLAWAAPRLGRRAPLAAAAALLLFAAQAGWTLQRRLTGEGGYVFYHRLGLALDGAVEPRQKVLVLTDNSAFYTPFYGDRYAVTFFPREGELLVENSGGRRPGVAAADVERMLVDGTHGLDVAVTARKDVTVPAIPWLRRLDDAQLRAFGVETGPTPWAALLERLCGPPRVHGGFLFWTLKRS
jgi:hypothetical protein